MVRRTANEIQAWLIGQLAALQHVSPDSIDPGASLMDLGLDSVLQLELELKIETWLACKLPDGIFWDYPTIESLCRYLANEE
jgi:acyl carrier protein